MLEDGFWFFDFLLHFGILDSMIFLLGGLCFPVSGT